MRRVEGQDYPAGEKESENRKGRSDLRRKKRKVSRRCFGAIDSRKPTDDKRINLLQLGRTRAAAKQSNWKE